MDRRAYSWLLGIAAVSLLLNLWGIDFGLPERWHPDEITRHAAAMAREGSLNPHEFRYGSLHFYQVLAVAVPTYLVSLLLGLDHDSQRSLVVLAARALSAVLGAGCVALTFLLARRLFDPTSAILAALFLALSLGLVNNAHFATVDVPMVFWMTASFLMAAEVLLTGRRRAYLLAGVFAGLAAATKYPGVVALLGLPVAHLLTAAARDHRALLLGLAASAASFLVVNPTLFLASCEFLEGIIRDNAYSASQGSERPIPAAVVDNLLHGLGGPLFVLVCGALVYAALLLRGPARPRILLLATMIVPSLLLLLSLNANYLRFVLPIFPPLAILAGKAGADLIGARARWLRLVGVAVAVVVIAVSALRSIVADLQIVYDARTLAAEWVERNLPDGATIEVTAHVALADQERFAVTRRPLIHNVRLDDWIERLTEAPIYRTLQPLYLAYRSFAEDAGICAPLPYHYRGWYDRRHARQIEAVESFDQSLAGLESRAPDVLIVSEGYYGRYRHDRASVEGRFFAGLFAGRSSYRQVARIRYQALPWPNPRVDFINPTIWIFRRAE